MNFALGAFDPFLDDQIRRSWKNLAADCLCFVSRRYLAGARRSVPRDEFLRAGFHDRRKSDLRKTFEVPLAAYGNCTRHWKSVFFGEVLNPRFVE